MIQIMEMTDSVLAENARRAKNREEMLNNPLVALALAPLGIFIPGTVSEDAEAVIRRGM